MMNDEDKTASNAPMGDDSPPPAEQIVARSRDEVMVARDWHVQQISQLEAQLEKMMADLRGQIDRHHGQIGTLTDFLVENQLDRPVPQVAKNYGGGVPSRGY